MDLFKMMGQLKDMKSKANEMDRKLVSFSAEGTADGISVLMNGKFEIKSFKLPEDISGRTSKDLEKSVMKAYSEAMKKTKAFVENEFGAIKSSLGLGNLF